MAENVRKTRRASAMRLSQHLDLDAQLQVLQLKEKIQEMTELVRQLLLHMDHLEKVPGFFSKEGNRTDSVATQTSPLGERSWENSPILKTKMKELVDMNLSWQKYNALQEKHIQELHNKVEEMQQKLTTAEDSSQLLRQQFHDENSRLEAEVVRLQQRTEQLQAVLEATGRRTGNAEREQLLEAQLMVYKEDFKTERRDRETARARVVQLEMELLELKRKMQTASPGFHYLGPYTVGDSGLQIDGDHLDSVREKLATDVPDGPPSRKTAQPPEPDKKKIRASKRDGLYNDGKLPVNKEDILCCTKCFKVFTKSEHLELLEHFEECDRQ